MPQLGCFINQLPLVVSFVCTGWGTYPGACFGGVFQEQAPWCVPALKFSVLLIVELFTSHAVKKIYIGFQAVCSLPSFVILSICKRRASEACFDGETNHIALYSLQTHSQSLCICPRPIPSGLYFNFVRALDDILKIQGFFLISPHKQNSQNEPNQLYSSTPLVYFYFFHSITPNFSVVD